MKKKAKNFVRSVLIRIGKAEAAIPDNNIISKMISLEENIERRTNLEKYE